MYRDYKLYKNHYYSYNIINNSFKWEVGTFLARLSYPLYALPNYSLYMSDLEIFSLIEDYIISLKKILFLMSIVTILNLLF